MHPIIHWSAVLLLAFGWGQICSALHRDLMIANSHRFASFESFRKWFPLTLFGMTLVAGLGGFLIGKYFGAFLTSRGI